MSQLVVLIYDGLSHFANSIFFVFHHIVSVLFCFALFMPCFSLLSCVMANSICNAMLSVDDSFSNLNVCEENHKPANDASLEVKHVNLVHAKEFTSTNSVASDVTDSAKTRLDVPSSPVAVPADMGSQNTLVNRTAKVKFGTFFTYYIVLVLSFSFSFAFLCQSLFHGSFNYDFGFN